MIQEMTLKNFLRFGDSTFDLGDLWPVVDRHNDVIFVQLELHQSLGRIEESEAFIDISYKYKGYRIGSCPSDIQEAILQEIKSNVGEEDFSMMLESILSDTHYESELETTLIEAFYGAGDYPYLLEEIILSLVDSEDLNDAVEDAAKDAVESDEYEKLFKFLEIAKSQARILDDIYESDAVWKAVDHIGEHGGTHDQARLAALVKELLPEKLDHPGEGTVVQTLSATDLIDIVKLAADPDWELRLKAASTPRAPADLLERLAADEDANVRAGVALNPDAPAALLQRLAKDEANEVREGVVMNPRSPDVALLLAGYEVRQDVASSSDSTVLRRLAKDKTQYVRGQVARNSATPADVINQLAMDPDSGVRYRAATNPSTPTGALEQLAMDPDYGVRQQVAMNPSTPIGVLEELAMQSDMQPWVARNPGASLDLLIMLAKYPDGRRSVAENVNASVELLLELSKNSDGSTRAGVSLNPKTPSAVLRQFAKDESSNIRYCVAKNRNTPVDVLHELTTDSSKGVRQNVAENSNASVATLEFLAADTERDVRRSVANNPNTPAALRSGLVAELSTSHLKSR